MDMPWDGADLRAAFNAELIALALHTACTRARIGFGAPTPDGRLDLGAPIDADGLPVPDDPRQAVVAPGRTFKGAALILRARSAIIGLGEPPGGWMGQAALSLCARAGRDGCGGFVRGTGLDGAVRDPARTHGTICSALDEGPGVRRRRDSRRSADPARSGRRGGPEGVLVRHPTKGV